MRGSPGRRPRATLSLLISVALAAGTLTALAAPAHADAAPPPMAPATPLQAALDQARSSGQPVTVDSMTTQTSITVAEPDGSVQSTANAMPVRVQRNSTWVPVSATLATNSDGTFSPAATPSGLKISAGGTGPLVTMTDPAGQSLTVTFPFALPAPTVSGAIATYADVLPDVDLQVTATDQGGFSDLLIVKSAAAAANPALASLNLATNTSGLTVSTDSAGNINAAAADGTVAFHAPTPMMWDTPATTAGTTQPQAKSPALVQATGSSGTVNASPTAVPIPVSETGSTLTLTPPTADLTGAGVNYPVYIDPAINPASSGTGGYTEVKAGCPTQTSFNTPQTNGEGIGYNNPYYWSGSGNDCAGSYRSFYELNTANLTSNMVVSKATLLTSETYGADLGCSNTHPVTVHWLASGIDTSTDWSNQPGYASGDAPSTQNPKTAWCATQDVDFDVTTDIKRLVAISGQAHWTFGLYGDESNEDGGPTNIGFMRFANNPSVTTVFDIAPNTPTNTTATVNGQGPQGPATQGCTTTGPYGWIGATSKASVSLTAYLATNVQGENAHADYTVWDNNAANNPVGSNVLTNIPNGPTVASGNYSPTTVNGLIDGHNYGWRVYDDDGILTSAAAPDCHFGVDLTPPFLNTGSINIASGNTGKYVNQPWSITLSATDPAPTTSCPVGNCGASGIAKITYSLNGCSDTGTVTGGSGTATVTPCTWGTNQLVITAYDNAGNQSQPYTYNFYAPDNPNPTPIIPGDINGAGSGISTPDLLSTTSTGALEVYPGGQDPSASGYQAAAPTDAPNGTSWTGALTTHRGAMSVLSGNTNVDDLWALQNVGTPASPKNQLFLYWNTGSGHYTTTKKTQINAPACAQSAQVITSTDTNFPCDMYDSADWNTVQQIAGITDVTGQGGKPDLLVVTKDTCNTTLYSTCTSTTPSYDLWLLYGGSATHPLANPVMIGSGGWDSFTITSPGPTTSSKLPDLWGRNTSTGAIYLYPNTLQTASDGTQVPIGLGTGTTKVQIGSGVTSSAFPIVAADGATDSNGHSILFIVTADGTLKQSTESNGSTFTSPAPLTQPGWAETTGATAAYPLNDDNTTQAADTSGNNNTIQANPANGTVTGTMTAITPVNTVVNGTSTWVDQFNGTSSSITAGGPLVNTAGSFTVSAWADPAVATNAGSIVSEDGTHISGFTLYCNAGGGWTFAMAPTDSTSWSADRTDTANNAATVGTWTHLVGVYDASAGTIKLYVNGALAATSSHTTPWSATGPLAIGRDFVDTSNTDLFNGEISDVEVYGYPMSSYQVSGLFTTHTPATTIG